MEGLGRAFLEKEIHEAISKGATGRIAVMAMQWSDEGNQMVVVPWTILSNPDQAEALGAVRLRGMPRTARRRRNLDQHGAAVFRHLQFEIAPSAERKGHRHLIGWPQQYQARPSMRFATDLVARGITINALTILNEWPTLDQYFERNVVGGQAISSFPPMTMPPMPRRSIASCCGRSSVPEFRDAFCHGRRGPPATAPGLALLMRLAAAHRGPEPLVGRSELHHATGDVRDTYFNLPAWQPGIAMGTKIVTVFPANPDRGALPAVQAVYALFDGKDGRPLALIDGTALTYRKTAADSALGSKLLSRPDSQILLMVGAGALAPYLIAAHRAVRPGLRQGSLYGTAGRTRSATLAKDAGAEVVEDLEEAVRRADIISSATASTEPLIQGNWLKPGTHLDLWVASRRKCANAMMRR